MSELINDLLVERGIIGSKDEVSRQVSCGWIGRWLDGCMGKWMD